MVDKALILRKLTELEEHLKQIKEFSNISVEDYSREWKTQRIVERTLQIMIEICADIANHIIADKGYRVPKSYADTFRVLYEKGIIEEEIFKMMENMAKFRNVVVHRYDKLDEYIVINILKKHLNDFLVYRNVIVDTLSQDEESNL